MRAWILILALLSLASTLVSTRPIIVMDQAPEPSIMSNQPIDPLIGNLTPDDVARGIWDLREQGLFVASPEQNVAMQEGLKIRRTIEELRAEREKLREALRQDILKQVAQ